MTTYYVYGLTDPRAMQMFYVGQSTNPKDRLNTHVAVANLPGKDGDGHAVKERVADILRAGFRPSMTILEKTPDKSREKHWIQHCLFLGIPLLNKAYTVVRTKEEKNAMQRKRAAKCRAKCLAETGLTKRKPLEII
jgi:hypothetical protein